MIRLMTSNAAPPVSLWVHTATTTLRERMPALERFVYAQGPAALSRHPAWSNVLREALGHDPALPPAYADLEARPQYCTVLYADADRVKAYIMEHAQAST